MSRLDQWLTGRTQQTAYKRRQTATFTHLKIHRADSTELSQHISQLSSCQCLSLSLSQSLNSRLRTALSLLGLLGNTASLASIYLTDCLKATLPLFLQTTHPPSIPPSLIILSLLRAARVRLLLRSYSAETKLIALHLRPSQLRTNA